MITLSVKSKQPLVKVNPDHRYVITEKSYGLILAAFIGFPMAVPNAAHGQTK